MRRTHWAVRASTLAGGAALLLVSACSDSTTPSPGTAISAADVSDIGAAAGDEVEQAVSALTNPAAQGVVSPTAPAGCATVDDQTDTDGDLAPDAATYTFALPACSFTGFRGGTLEVTGTIVLSDPTPDAPDLAATATLNDFTFAFTSPNATRTYTAVRNGTRTLTGNASGATLSNAITVVRSAPGRADATVVHNLLLTFTPAPGESLAFGAPLPDGTFTKSGTFTWSRGTTSLTFTVTTVEPLVWDASCTTERKIASGEIHATLADGGYIRTVWTACGEDPSRSYVPAS
ncbi:MAG TPA: hypothetical protein VFN40_02590 [Gemmatimonadales bacterium]|nr:hypothetical protein [Gemmatimonadales bacterium]